MRQRLFAFLRGLANLVFAFGLSLGFQLLLKGRIPDLLGILIATALLVSLYVAGARWIERRRPVELQRSDFLQQISTGLALGVALFSSVMGILCLLGAYRPSGWNSLRPVGLGLLVALLVAVSEEIVFRGFLFRLFACLASNWTALAVTAALFGLAHAANPQATLASSAAIAIEAGILPGAAYAATGSLWLPIGIHAGWNFAEGPIFGMAISGRSQPAGLIAGALHGPAILTGAAFGSIHRGRGRSPTSGCTLSAQDASMASCRTHRKGESGYIANRLIRY